MTIFNPFNKKSFYLSLVFLAACCGVYMFIYTQIQNNGNASTAAELSWQSVAKTREELKSLDQSLKAVAEERAALDTHFIKIGDEAPFLDMLEKLAPTVGAVSEVSSVDIAKDNSGLNVDLQVDGKFESIYKFLTLLENSPYEISITYLDLQKKDSTDTTTIDEKAKPTATNWSARFRLKLLTLVK